MDRKPYTKDWWWDRLLEHVYYCKWRYRSEKEMIQDSELTSFIIHRIEKKILEEKYYNPYGKKKFYHRLIIWFKKIWSKKI